MNLTVDNWTLVDEAGSPVNTDPSVRGTCVRQLQWLLALLRAQYWMYQNLHWEAQGDAGYGHHLLFQRIYAGDEDNEGEDDDGIQGEVDALAEKMVGAYGNEAVCSDALIAMVKTWVEKWGKVECAFRRALYSEQCAHACVRRTYESLKKMGALSLGMDDFLMSLDSEHETNEYLLRQVLRSKESAERSAGAWRTLRGGGE